MIRDDGVTDDMEGEEETTSAPDAAAAVVDGDVDVDCEVDCDDEVVVDAADAADADADEILSSNKQSHRYKTTFNLILLTNRVINQELAYNSGPILCFSKKSAKIGSK